MSIFKTIMLFLCLAASTAVVACGDDGGGGTGDGDADGDTDGDTDTDTDTDSDTDVPAGCDALAEGMNTGFEVGSTTRSFILNLPDGATDDGSGNWGVVFNWHGLGDTAANMAGLISGQVDNSAMPFIGVTPEDANFQVMGQPLDWDVFSGTAGNTEIALFDAVLVCLESRYGVDENHIHSMGFSLGSSVTDLLGTLRGDVVASLGTYSGVYWSNPANDGDLGMAAGFVNWDAFNSNNLFTQMFVHGGSADTYDATAFVLQYSASAVRDSEWLGGMGADTIICDHSGGHTVPSSVPASLMIEFFADHPLGTAESPYDTDGLPGSFPGICAFQPSTE